MAVLEGGIPTLHSRAEAWECDFNGHWNTRFYCKAFQTAGEVAAKLAGHPGQEQAATRQVRFHAELHSGDPITIRSFEIPDAGSSPVIAHYMFRNGQVVATAADYGLPRAGHLTTLPAAEAHMALPRGLKGPVPPPWDPAHGSGQLYELGPLAAEDLHADGAMAFWRAVARMSNASHHHDIGLGFTLERMKQESIGRMLAEMRYTQLKPCKPDDFLRCASKMTSARGKAFTVAHMLYTHRGTPVAIFELCTLAVDMTTRRAMALPDFVTAWVP